jgi:hypothetical protein
MANMHSTRTRHTSGDQVVASSSAKSIAIRDDQQSTTGASPLGT